MYRWIHIIGILYSNYYVTLYYIDVKQFVSAHLNHKLQFYPWAFVNGMPVMFTFMYAWPLLKYFLSGKTPWSYGCPL